MAWQTIAMWTIVAGVGFPAAIRFSWPPTVRNVTALAMVIAWLTVELVYQTTGDNLPLKFSFMADVAVITVIYAKMIRQVGVKRYPSLPKQIYCMFVDLTPCDRLIVAIFLLGVWPAYVVNIPPAPKWNLLWGLTILQYLLAGAEAIQSFRHDVKARASSDPPGNGLALAGVRRWSMR